MGEALFDLERILRSRQEKLTSQEANILLACKAQAMRDFTIGFGGGSVTTWLATQRLSNLVRFNFTLGVAAISGLWKFGRSLDSSIEHILSLEGSRMQMELANVMLKKYHSDPWVIERLSRHFYSEEVYDDSSADQPKVRWRFRNYFGDNVAHPQTTSNNEDTDLEKNNLKKTSREAPKNYTNAAGDVMANPFDCIFGLPASIEEIPHPDTSSTLSRRQRRIQKRSHRRHRKHHPEVSDV
ncbi:uncharacterized protein LOC111403088 isoform X1 [Olea europaea var. sylvestris]|uniref:Uncharacterized protein n=1 Tax=Olea europaea subsp. europaea TaxID=158383 RepID=A0A8S0U0F4_OLEEU|nr:uncharacterized protein LOC111403088 isoform X1 [Olea europaea var. sylvestris]CAA3009590.1 Hypothetical predicted protein [Olea europaea subsp. europaea]